MTPFSYWLTPIKQELEKAGKLKKNEVFVDLGSGIGSIVMQAAMLKCDKLKCAIGIGLVLRRQNSSIFLSWF